MNNLVDLLRGLQASGELEPGAKSRYPTPLPRMERHRVAAETAVLSQNVAGTLRKSSFQRLLDVSPQTARTVMGQLQGSPIPEFPLGGLGG